MIWSNKEMTVLSYQKGWAEQDPNLWWKNICRCTKKIVAKTEINPADILGIGIAYQMHGLVLVDEKGKPLRPSIIWKDNRAVEIGEQALYDMGVDFCFTNMLNSPGNFTAAKLKKAAKKTGLKKGIPLSYRAGDQLNNALSLKVLNKGEVAITSSNSGVVYGVVQHLMADSKSRVNSFAHVNYDDDFRKIGILLCLNGAGSLYSWVKQNISRRDTEYIDMERMLSSVPIGSSGVCIMPFGNGSERIFNNKNIDAHIHNLQFVKHSKAHIYRAAIEGVAFAFIYGLELLRELGLEINTIRVGSSDMFQSKVFINTISTLLGKEIEVLNTSGAMGAALASGVGVGVYASIKDAVSNIEVKNIQMPTYDYARCSQAYSYWRTMLDRSISSAQRPVESNDSMSRIAELNKLLSRKNRLIEGQALESRENAELREKMISIANAGLKDGKEQKIRESLEKMLYVLNTKKTQTKEILEGHMDILNESFVKKMMELYPALSFEELRLSYYIRSQFSTKEIASRMSLSKRGVETKRYRLRKKFDLSRAVNLSTFLRNIK